jgi:AcrR family transcriptional regulator
MGRPRLFDDKTERRKVMDAAVRVMVRNGYASMSVADVLAEANLTTSSFYRHFSSKDALAEALVRRDGRSARRSLDQAITTASDPLAALDAWLEAVLDLFFAPGRAERTMVLSASDVMSSRLASVANEMRWLLAEPAAEVLRAGHAEGVLHSPNPEADAVSLFALVSSAATSARSWLGTRTSTKSHVLRFVGPALRIDHTGDRAAGTNARPKARTRRGTRRA